LAKLTAYSEAVAEPRGANPAFERVWRKLPEGTREQLESGLPPTDLRSLLIGLAATRAARVTRADLVASWRRDRFVQPSACDPRRLSSLEAQLWQLLPDEFAGVELSPVAPLGSCSALGPVSQNRVVSTMRLSEVVSDAANSLAIEAAVRRVGQAPDGQVHLAAAHRLLRAQVFTQAAAHFRLFTLVSSARDKGSARTEAELLNRHLAYWVRTLETLVAAREPRIEVTVFDQPVLAARLADTVLSECHSAAVRVVENPSRERGRGYYAGFAMRLSVHAGELEIGDGGLTTWTAQLTGNAKERCLISCMATELLTELADRSG
jgi:hypothetical protein